MKSIDIRPLAHQFQQVSWMGRSLNQVGPSYLQTQYFSLKIFCTEQRKNLDQAERLGT